jgi:hypothetical protein
MIVSKNPPKKPDWLPDWEDVTKYPEPEASGRVWAWEFLRRNPQYQQLWEKRAALMPFGFGWDLMDIEERFRIEFSVSRPASPAMPFTHPDFKWWPRFTTQNPKYWIMPEEDDEGNSPDLADVGIDHPAEVLVKFDLRCQIDAQLNDVKEILHKELKRLKEADVLSGEPRAWFDKYQKYLRVLDAKLTGVNRKTIAVEILDIKNDDPEYQKDKVDYAFARAKQLRDKDYRFLAARGK